MRKILFFMVFVYGLNHVSGQMSATLIDSITINESKNYGWFPSLQMLSTGEMICDFSMDPDVNGIEGVWGYTISKDNGKSWGRRHTAGSFFREASYTRDPALKDGSMMMLAGIPLPVAGSNFKKIEATALKFSNGGKTTLFTDDVVISFPTPVGKVRIYGSKLTEAANMYFTGHIVKSRDNGWITLMYGKLEGDRYYRTVVVKSKDFKNWNYVSTIGNDKDSATSEIGADQKTYQGFCESRMLRLNDGRMFVVMRTGYSNPMHMSWSSDDGKTWTVPQSMGFKGVEPSMILMKSGALALCTGRPGPTTLRFSRDNGSTWISTAELNTNIPTRGHYASTSYTGMVEYEANKLFIVYDQVNSDLGENPQSDSLAINYIFGKSYQVSYSK